MRVLIVDDEPLARRGLRKELERMSEVECVGECRTRDEAVVAIVERQPDVVLLDVQLGRRTGFEVIETIGVDAMPLVIFVTAYDRHAIRAFDVHAVDYVLKPVDPDRLREALDRASHRRTLEQGGSLAERLERLLESGGATVSPGDAPAAMPERIVVHDGEDGRLSFVDVAAIDWVEADGNYVRLHVGPRTHLLRSTMAQMEQRVGSAFVRIRRSALVNSRAITSIDPYGKGMFRLNLRGGAHLISSRYHQAGLKSLLSS